MAAVASSFVVPRIVVSSPAAERKFSNPFLMTRRPSMEPEEQGFRSSYLMPPPSIRERLLQSPASSRSRGHQGLSPLSLPSHHHDHQNEVAIPGSPRHGLDSEAFEKLLRASSTPVSMRRSAAQSSAKPAAAADLRKEIVNKAHQQAKMLNRRALFLAKLAAPPSPSATATPKTPPESPGVFHFSLPSPGLQSPLAMFDDRSREEIEAETDPWVERVDFQQMVWNPPASPAVAVAGAGAGNNNKKKLPSLDQISAHLNAARGPIPLITIEHETPVSAHAPGSASRLPAFLLKQLPSIPTATGVATPKSAAATVIIPMTPSKCDLAPHDEGRARTRMDMLSTLGKRAGTKRHSAPPALMLPKFGEEDGAVMF